MRKTDPAFQDAYRAASRARLSGTVGRLRVAAGEAVDTLRAALRDELTSNRIRAAIALLHSAVTAEVDELTQRVDAIEARQRLDAVLAKTRRDLRQLDEGLGGG